MGGPRRLVDDGHRRRAVAIFLVGEHATLCSAHPKHRKEARRNARAAHPLRLVAARRDLDAGIALVPADPFGWYASASLAARAGDLARARADIAKAASLAPDDAGIRTLSASLAKPAP